MKIVDLQGNGLLSSNTMTTRKKVRRVLENFVDVVIGADGANSRGKVYPCR